MINNTDGSKRLPTAKERLDGIKSRSNGNISSFRADNENGHGPDIYHDDSHGQYDSRPLELANGRDRRIEDDTSHGPSQGIADTGTGGGQVILGDGDASSHEHSVRVATADGTNANYKNGYTVNDAPALQPSKNNWWDRARRGAKEAKDAIASSSKEKQSKRKPRANKVLNERETLIKRDRIAKSLLWQSDHLDELLKATTTGHDPYIVIWSNIDGEQSIVLANSLIRWSKKSTAVSDGVEIMLNIDEDIETAIILLPRVYKSLMLYLTKGFSIR